MLDYIFIAYCQLPFSMKKMLVQTLVMPHFDYCDILLPDLSVTSAQRLQRVHNMCVRFVCNIRRADHVTPSLEMLSWLRLEDRRKIHCLSLLFHILHFSTPVYLASRFQNLSTHHNLDTRSQHSSILSIPSHRTSSYSSSFTVAVLRLWNSLPSNVRDCQTSNQFKNRVTKYFSNNSCSL